ncbi:MAG: hypothetical protein ACFE8N_10050 [Promethearchaeota archaeon]
MKTDKLDLRMTPQNVNLEFDFNENQEYSVNIVKTDEILQYIVNLSELLPDTYPNVHIESIGNHYRLWSENETDLQTVVDAFFEAIDQR